MSKRGNLSRNLKCFWIGSILSSALTLSAPAQSETTTTMFILDASGSMWGRLPGDIMKIVTARETMGTLIGNLPENVSVGLMAYGHRRKGDCNDIEIVQPVGADATANIQQKLDQLIPRGKTPISDSLVQAADSLKSASGEKAIVLVSDGIETCSGDPCKLAESLSEANIDLKIHVVGLAVDPAAREQLQCVAEKGNGQYFSAQDATGLQTALTTVTEAISTSAEIVVETPNVDVVSTNINIGIAGPGTIRLSLADWVSKPTYWRVLNPETGEEITKTTDSEVNVLPGQYQLAWRHLEHGSQEVTIPEIITVKTGEVSIADINTGLRLVPPEGIKRPYYWQLLPEGADLDKDFRKRAAAAWYSVWEAVPVPPGNYTLIVRQSEHDHSEVNLGTVSLAKSELQQLTLDQGVNVAWAQDWGNRPYIIRFTAPDGNSVTTDTSGPFFLAPGAYDVSFRLKEHGYSEASFGKVNVPESGFVDAQINSGIAFKTELDARFTIFATDLETGREAMMKDRWGPMPLGAGRYRFDLKLDGQPRQTIVPELAIKTGQFIVAEM